MNKLLITFPVLIVLIACQQRRPSTNDNMPATAMADPAKQASPMPAKRRCIEPGKAELPRILESKTFNAWIVDYKGISFSYSPLLASAVVAETKSANLLQCDTDKPDYDNYPEHQAFRLNGSYASRFQQEDGWNPEIRIYSVAAYKETFAVQDTESTKNFVHSELRKLETILTTKPSSFGRKAPFMLFIDGHQELLAKVRYLNFKNGQGIAYITKYGVDRYPVITNETPIYVFQGFTSDGKYLVSATFPINIAFLPKNVDAVNWANLPFDANEKDDEPTRKRVAAYVTKITQQCERLSDEKYKPNLKLFDELIQSLTVTPK